MEVETIDAEVFRGLLPDGAGTGVNLRIDDEGRTLWTAIRDLRDEARRIERRADDGDPNASRDAAIAIWAKLADRCAEVLLTRSRDLAVAATWVESLTRTQGFAGLAEGCDAIRAMVEAHWPNLYPVPDPDEGTVDEQTADLERALPLVRLAGEESEGLLVPAILHVPLIDGKGGERFGLCHWRSSRDLSGVDDADKLKIALERGGTSPEHFQTALTGTPWVFLQQTFADVLRARQAWDQLAKAVDDASAGRAVLPTLPIRSLLEECEAAFETFAPEAIAQVRRTVVEGDAPVASEAPGPTAVPRGEASGGRHPQTREDVLRTLEAAAEFFEHHDPHSLLAAQVRNIVRMARLPRTEYYRELIREEGGLQSLARMAGLQFDQ